MLCVCKCDLSREKWVMMFTAFAIKNRSYKSVSERQNKAFKLSYFELIILNATASATLMPSTPADKMPPA